MSNDAAVALTAAKLAARGRYGQSATKLPVSAYKIHSGRTYIWSGSMALPPLLLHSLSVIITKPLPLHEFIAWQS